MKNIIFLAPPAAGKGTQGEILSAKYGYPIISTGQLLRNVASTDSPLANTIKEIQESGRLVGDDIVIELLKSRISEDDAKNGYILDGFPRNINQAEVYNEMIQSLGVDLGVVIYISIDFNTALERACGRITCSSCNAIYNKYVSGMIPKVEGICDKCGSELISRSDDNEESFKVRFDTYMDNTSPLIEYYKNLGVLHEVTARENKDEVAELIERIINE